MAAKPGLQAERTQLAWERTAIGYLAVAALVLSRHQGPLGPVRTGLALLAAVLAVLVFAIARIRGRHIADCREDAPNPTSPCPTVEVFVTGIATVVLAAALLTALALAT